MTADDRADQIRARLAAATPGPWRQGAVDFNPLEVWANRDPAGWDAFLIATCCTRLNPQGTDEGQDADLIANAPADLAFLLAERTELLRRVEQAERAGHALAMRLVVVESERKDEKFEALNASERANL